MKLSIDAGKESNAHHLFLLKTCATFSAGDQILRILVVIGYPTNKRPKAKAAELSIK